MHFLQGLIGMVAGFLIIVFRARIKDLTGNIGFAERYLGTGGTWTFLAILGALIFIFSLMWSTGSLQRFMQNTLGPILG